MDGHDGHEEFNRLLVVLRSIIALLLSSTTMQLTVEERHILGNDLIRLSEELAKTETKDTKSEKPSERR